MTLNLSAAARPAHFHWMAQTPELGGLRIDQLILPGSHNAGSDKLSPNSGIPKKKLRTSRHWSSCAMAYARWICASRSIPSTRRMTHGDSSCFT